MLPRSADPDVEQTLELRIVRGELDQNDDRSLEALEAADRVDGNRVVGLNGDLVGAQGERLPGVVDLPVPEDLVAEPALAPDVGFLEAPPRQDGDLPRSSAL